jgi:hypothetical protein
MDPVLPTIRAGELSGLAQAFAQDLAKRLENINQAFPCPTLRPEVEPSVAWGKEISWPDPYTYLRIFESSFCRYMASYRVVIPDDE